MSDTDLDEHAIGILKANDRGGYTVPTARLYPFQWNWDSAFAALGFAAFDRDRAWGELDKLFQGQWADGMVPHIIFWSPSTDYFPGPDVWASGTEPPTSGISQPPVAASIVAELVSTGDDSDLERASRLYPKLLASHRWFHTHRDPENRGVIAVVHPWESGRDNCPDWDPAMDTIAVAPDLETYQRRDTEHIGADQRPSTAQYDRYLTILTFGRNQGWDQQEIIRAGPFLVGDPGIHFILLRADRDLLGLAKRFGSGDDEREIGGWIARAEQAADGLWNEEAGGFTARDLRSGVFSSGLASVSPLSLYAGAGSPGQRERIANETRRIIERVRFALPSWDPDHPAFEQRRYWRGPVWLIMNYMIARGFREAGSPDVADRIADDALRLVRQSGFFEYYCPMTGEGLGGGDFTWTAAVWLALRGPEIAQGMS